MGKHGRMSAKGGVKPYHCDSQQKTSPTNHSLRLLATLRLCLAHLTCTDMCVCASTLPPPPLLPLCRRSCAFCAPELLREWQDTAVDRRAKKMKALVGSVP